MKVIELTDDNIIQWVRELQCCRAGVPKMCLT